MFSSQACSDFHKGKIEEPTPRCHCPVLTELAAPRSLCVPLSYTEYSPQSAGELAQTWSQAAHMGFLVARSNGTCVMGGRSDQREKFPVKA